jgi:hypothetical protein
LFSEAIPLNCPMTTAGSIPKSCQQPSVSLGVDYGQLTVGLGECSETRPASYKLEYLLPRNLHSPRRANWIAFGPYIRRRVYGFRITHRSSPFLEARTRRVGSPNIHSRGLCEARRGCRSLRGSGSDRFQSGVSFEPGSGTRKSPRMSSERTSDVGQLRTDQGRVRVLGSALRSHIGEEVSGRTIVVRSVPADEGFWIGNRKGDRVWVRILRTGESGVKVRAGETVTHGQCRGAPADVCTRFGSQRRGRSRRARAQPPTHRSRGLPDSHRLTCPVPEL